MCVFFLLSREEGLSALLAVVAVTIPNVFRPNVER